MDLTGGDAAGPRPELFPETSGIGIDNLNCALKVYSANKKYGRIE